MADDRERLLAQFERKGSAPRSPSSTAPEGDTADANVLEFTASDEYLAYKSEDRKHRRLQLCPIKGSYEWVTYQYLLRVVLDPSRRRIALIFSFMAITIKGVNLLPLAEAIADEHCTFIDEFDPKRWKRPTNPDITIVETIEFMTDKPPATAAEKEST